MILTESLVNEYIHSANELLAKVVKEFEYTFVNGVEFSSATSYWMQIKRLPDHSYSIRVSKLFNQISDERKFKSRLMSSCIHELIHTIPGCWNHGRKFKMICERVNKVCPEYNLSTSTSSEEFGFEIPSTPAKYHVTCMFCRTVSEYKRTPKYLDCFNSVYSCSKCGRSNFKIERVNNT